MQIIVFPLFGTGTGKAKPEQMAARFMMAAIEYLESNEKTALETVYFPAWTDRDLEICESALHRRAVSCLRRDPDCRWLCLLCPLHEQSREVLAITDEQNEPQYGNENSHH